MLNYCAPGATWFRTETPCIGSVAFRIYKSSAHVKSAMFTRAAIGSSRILQLVVSRPRIVYQARLTTYYSTGLLISSTNPSSSRYYRCYFIMWLASESAPYFSTWIALEPTIGYLKNTFPEGHIVLHMLTLHYQHIISMRVLQQLCFTVYDSHHTRSWDLSSRSLRCATVPKHMFPCPTRILEPRWDFA
jgi:hypothetical protein